AAAFPAPTTIVRPAGGGGRFAGTALSGEAAAIAASNISRSNCRSFIGRAPSRLAAGSLSSRCFLLADLVTGESLEHTSHARMVPCRAACGDRSVEQLLTSGGVWQADAERTRALQCEVQVLLMQRDAETGLEIALDHAFAVHLKDAGRSESSHQRLPHTGRIGASLGSENERLADSLDRQGDDDLVRDLGRLSVAIAADKRDILAHEREDRLDLLEGRLGPPDHDRETRRLGAALAPGNRRVEIFAAQFVDLLGEVLGRDWGDRAHIDNDLAL